jgi:hypothetical protein
MSDWNLPITGNLFHQVRFVPFNGLTHFFSYIGLRTINQVAASLADVNQLLGSHGRLALTSY